MSWNPNQGQDPNQPGAYPSQPSQYGGPTNDPYAAQQGGYQQGYQPGQQPQYPPPQYQQQPPQYQQQPPYDQQQQYSGYQQPYGAPGGNPAYGQLGPTSMGMQANVAAGVSYIVGWITGLIFFFGEKQNRFVRFHAMQSIILFGGLTVLDIVVNVLAGALVFSVPGFSVLLFGLVYLVGIAGFVLWIILLINAFQGKYFKLPVIGDYAEKYANPTGTTY
ncbi:MAG TPA: hypothetical protein VGT44_14230 [Ktedonobacteraceae bacterium]|nr:hypothetical protein [Ktedonobacteraceae bacterium]